jgi:Fe2+ or Zn2+ uptake regulation protein
MLGDKDLWKIDTTETGISVVMNEYQYAIIKHVLEYKKNITTGNVHAQLEHEGIKVSRASVINYCKLLADNGIITFTEESGKGGYHRVYAAKLSFEEIIKHMTNSILNSLLNAFPKSDYLQFLTQEG